MAENQLERISEMERRLDLIKEAVANLELALDRYAEVQGEIELLDRYYGSEEWRRDFEDDAAGKLPKTLKRGVLSEDGAWNALNDARDLNCRIAELRQNNSVASSYKVITLCGSTKFKEQFLAAQKRLTLEGNIVISVGLFGHSGDDEVWTEGTKAMLDDMHKRKIDMADEIFVINVGGYIGESTRSEIAYAKAQGIAVRYLE